MSEEVLASGLGPPVAERSQPLRKPVVTASPRRNEFLGRPAQAAAGPSDTPFGHTSHTHPTMKIHGTPSQPPRPDDGRRPADAPNGSSFEADSARVDTPGSALPAREGDSATAATSGERGDRLEVSSAGRLMQPDAAEAASADRLAELAKAQREGTLNSPERLELAARRILEGFGG